MPGIKSLKAAFVGANTVNEPGRDSKLERPNSVAKSINVVKPFSDKQVKILSL